MDGGNFTYTTAKDKFGASSFLASDVSSKKLAFYGTETKFHEIFITEKLSKLPGLSRASAMSQRYLQGIKGID